MRVAVITSGGFDPIHEGHIEYLEKAKDLYINEAEVMHFCIVNAEHFLIKKKGYAFYSEKQRLEIIRALRCVDEAVLSIDTDMTVCNTIRCMYERLKNNYDKIVFAKGGDRFNYEIPEAKVCKELGIEMVDGLGKKIASSSYIVAKYEKAKGEIKK